MPIDYTNTTVTGYNTSPPVDDGTASEANRTKWQTIKEKLADPLKTAIESIDTQVTTSIGSIPILTGDQSIWLPALNWNFDNSSSISSGDTSMDVGLFSDDNTHEFGHCTVVLPKKWNLGEMTAKLYLVSTAAAAGDVKMDVSAVAVDSGSSIFGSLGTEATETITVDSTQYDVTVSGDLSFTPSDTPAYADVVLLRIERDHAAAGDTLSADIGVIGMLLTYTSTAVTDD